MFKTKDNKNNGLLLIGALVSSIGFILFTAFYVLFKDLILESYQEKSDLFINNYYYVIPFAFFMMYTLILEAYLMGMMRTVFSYFLRHVLTRILWMLDILLYHFGVVDWDTFLLLFVLSYSVNLAVLSVYLLTIGSFNFSLNSRFRRYDLYKVMGTYSLYSMLSGISNFMVNRIDIIMIGFISLNGLNDAAIYAIAVYMASVIHVPAQSIARISFPLIANKWRERKIDEIDKIYKASARDQLILGGTIFIIIWANVDVIFQVLPQEYEAGKWALFFLGIAKLIDMASGVNGVIINATRYYRFDLYVSVFLIITTIVTNIWLIQLYGLVGAAIATAFSVLLYNVIRLIYILSRLKMQPFNGKTVVIILVLMVAFFAQALLPTFEIHFIIDAMFRAIVIVTLMIIPIYFLKLSEEINNMLRNLFVRK